MILTLMKTPPMIKLTGPVNVFNKTKIHTAIEIVPDLYIFISSSSSSFYIIKFNVRLALIIKINNNCHDITMIYYNRYQIFIN